MVYPYNPTNDPIRVYGRKPTIAEIVDNRKCHEYINFKRYYGTLGTISDKDSPTGTKTVWFPDQRSIAELWAEARLTYTNAFPTTAPKFDNPEIDLAALA